MTRYLLIVHGDVEPETVGPFGSDAARVDYASGWRTNHGDDDGLYRVDLDKDYSVSITPFGGAELE